MGMVSTWLLLNLLLAYWKLGLMTLTFTWLDQCGCVMLNGRLLVMVVSILMHKIVLMRPHCRLMLDMRMLEFWLIRISGGGKVGPIRTFWGVVDSFMGHLDMGLILTIVIA